MFRIGIIGTENSHALAFSKIMNLPDPVTGRLKYPDVRVTGVYGPDRDSAAQIVDEAKAAFIAEDPADFLGKVDAMLITCRKGSLHAQYALPFIEKGMPLFIDKPFTADVKEAEELISAAKKSGSRLIGGSGCKLAYDVLTLAAKAKAMIASGDLVSASMNYAADPESEYDGFYFYAPHLTEMALTIFGADVKSIRAYENNGSRVAIWRYQGFDVTLHYTKGTHKTACSLYAKSGNFIREIDISMIYGEEVDHLVHMLRTGEMPGAYEDLIAPVKMIGAVEEAIKTGGEVVIK